MNGLSAKIDNKINLETSDPHGGEYEDDCVLGSLVSYKLADVSDSYPDDDGSKNLRNVGQFLLDYMSQHPRRQSSSYYSCRENLFDKVI
jgi:hypothetical protein